MVSLARCRTVSRIESTAISSRCGCCFRSHSTRCAAHQQNVLQHKTQCTAIQYSTCWSKIYNNTQDMTQHITMHVATTHNTVHVATTQHIFKCVSPVLTPAAMPTNVRCIQANWSDLGKESLTVVFLSNQEQWRQRSFLNTRQSSHVERACILYTLGAGKNASTPSTPMSSYADIVVGLLACTPRHTHVVFWNECRYF